jgi:excisionase family DNA binding protein
MEAAMNNIVSSEKYFNFAAERMGYAGASKYTGIPESSLRKYVCQRRIPFLKPFGRKGRVVFLKSDLDAFLLASRVPATSVS